MIYTVSAKVFGKNKELIGTYDGDIDIHPLTPQIMRIKVAASKVVEIFGNSAKFATIQSMTLK